MRRNGRQDDEKARRDSRRLAHPPTSATRTYSDNKNAAEWLPPNKAFHCQYIVDQVRIKAAYGLSVTLPEKKAMLRVLQGC